MTAIRNEQNAELICERRPAVEIYALIDPRDCAVRYVGKAKNSAARLLTHLRDAKSRRTPVYIWIRELRALGMTPVVEVLHVVAEDQWCAVEREEIAGRSGLLNVAPGGNQPIGNPETNRANAIKLVALREANPKRKRLQYLRMQITRALHNGYVRSDSAKAKLRVLIDRWPERYGEWAALLK